MSDELSDRAMSEWVEQWCDTNPEPPTYRQLYAECRRRSDALIEDERSVRIRVEQMYQTLTESIETERRNAFEACWEYADGDIKKLMSVDEAYRVYTEAEKEAK